MEIYSADVFFYRSCDYYDANKELMHVSPAKPGDTWTTNPNLVTSEHKPNASPPVYRFLSHIKEGTLTYPPSPFTYYGHTFDVVSSVDAYWNAFYSSAYYDKVSGPDPSMNCHGYTTGKNVWLDDCPRLLADDYVFSLFASALANNAIAATNGFSGPYGGDHSVKIDQVTPTAGQLGTMITKISEKCRDSGIYEANVSLSYSWLDIVSFNLPTGHFAGFYLPK
ncbi:MAG: hypothetical protein LBI05_07455 [Planctomycetaceae bacterium]|nr:hypothetical protein [Planctomycetaceae bacterium]